LPDKSLKPKYFGDNANRASRDWSRGNHRSGAQVAPAGHRMINQENDKQNKNQTKNKHKQTNRKNNKLNQIERAVIHQQKNRNNRQSQR